jgi:hypothetical protein
MNRLRAALLVLLLSLLPMTARAEGEEVDLALVLAIDCSFSVDASEFRQQMQGTGQALRDDAVWEAIEMGRTKRIAITVFQWSDNDNQVTVVPWTVIDSKETAQAVGASLEILSRKTVEGGTSITNAMLFAAALFDSAPVAIRKVIDVSTDGRNNIGPPLPPVRDHIVSNNISINALAILNEFPMLHKYAEKHIIGGHGSFVVKAESYDDYGAAILRKLIKEITGPGVV